MAGHPRVTHLSTSQHNKFSYLGSFNLDSGIDPGNDFRKGSPSRVLAKEFCIFLVDLRSGFGPRMQLLQVYRSGSTRSVFIINLLLLDNALIYIYI